MRLVHFLGARCPKVLARHCRIRRARGRARLLYKVTRGEGYVAGDKRLSCDGTTTLLVSRFQDKGLKGIALR